MNSRRCHRRRPAWPSPPCLLWRSEADGRSAAHAGVGAIDDEGMGKGRQIGSKRLIICPIRAQVSPPCCVLPAQLRQL